MPNIKIYGTLIQAGEGPVVKSNNIGFADGKTLDTVLVDKVSKDNLVKINGQSLIGGGDIDIPAGKDGKDGASGKDGKDGVSPEVGANGNWWIGSYDTGVKAQGNDGAPGAPGQDGQPGADGDTPEIGENGNWWIGGVDTGIAARGESAPKIKCIITQYAQINNGEEPDDDTEWNNAPGSYDPAKKYWIRSVTIYEDTSIGPSYSDPVIDNALNDCFVQIDTKSATYYSDLEPDHSILKQGDCWFDTTNKLLKQWDGESFQDIGDEIVANKVTATYVNALGITAEKIEIKSSDTNVVLYADAKDVENTKVGGFNVTSSALVNGITGLDDGTNSGVYVGTDGIRIGTNESFIKLAANGNIDISGNIKTGLKGNKGDDAVRYYIDTPYRTVSKKINGDVNPEQINLKFYKQLGGNDPVPHNGYFEWVIDNKIDDPNFKGSGTGTEFNIPETALKKIEFDINVKLYDKSTIDKKIVDEISICLVLDGQDGSKGDDGIAYSLSIGNDFVSIPCDNEGNPVLPDTKTLKDFTSHIIYPTKNAQLILASAITWATDIPTQESGYTIRYIISDGVSYNSEDAGNYRKFWVSELAEDTASSISYELYEGTNKVAEAKFEATKQLAGSPGEAAVLYRLYSKNLVIKRNKTGAFEDGSFWFDLEKITGKEVQSTGVTYNYKVYVDGSTQAAVEETHTGTNHVYINLGTAAGYLNPANELKIDVFSDATTKCDSETITVLYDGVGLDSTQSVIKYCTNDSGTEHPAPDSEEWQSTIPEVADGNYLWTQTAIAYTDGTKSYSYSVARDPEDGVGISGAEIKYAVNMNNTEVPTDWSDDIPEELPQGFYLWTRTILLYSDEQRGDPAYSIAKIGTDGINYNLTIENDFVSIPCKTDGSIIDESHLEMATTHYLLPTKDLTSISANDIIWSNTVPTAGNDYTIVVKTTNITLEYEIVSNIGCVAYKVWATAIGANTGSVQYDLYLGTSRIAAAKFEVTKQLNGADAVFYRLVDDISNIRKTSDGEFVSIGFDFDLERVIEGIPEYELPFYYEIFVDDNETAAISGTHEKGSGSIGIAFGDDAGKVNPSVKLVINAYADSSKEVQYDRETINVIVDGYTPVKGRDYNDGSTVENGALYYRSNSATAPAQPTSKTAAGWSLSPITPAPEYEYTYKCDYTITNDIFVPGAVTLDATCTTLVSILSDENVNIISKDEETGKYYLKADAINDTMGTGNVVISGFKVGKTALESGAAGTNEYVHLGTDGLKIGTNFEISPNGTMTIGDYAKSTDVSTAKEEVLNTVTSKGYQTEEDVTSRVTSGINSAKSVILTEAGTQTDNKISTAKTDVLNTVESKGYKNEAQVTEITNTTISTTDILAKNLKVNAANIQNLEVKKLNVRNDNRSILYADVDKPKNTYIGGFNVNDGELSSGTNENKVAIIGDKLVQTENIKTVVVNGVTYNKVKWIGLTTLDANSYVPIHKAFAQVILRDGSAINVTNLVSLGDGYYKLDAAAINDAMGGLAKPNRQIAGIVGGDESIEFVRSTAASSTTGYVHEIGSLYTDEIKTLPISLDRAANFGFDYEMVVDENAIYAGGNTADSANFILKKDGKVSCTNGIFGASEIFDSANFDSSVFNRENIWGDFYIDKNSIEFTNNNRFFTIEVNRPTSLSAGYKRIVKVDSTSNIVRWDEYQYDNDLMTCTYTESGTANKGDLLEGNKKFSTIKNDIVTGFNIGSNRIYNQKQDFNTSGDGVYIGDDGLAVADTLKVDVNNNITQITQMHIGIQKEFDLNNCVLNNQITLFNMTFDNVSVMKFDFDNISGTAIATGSGYHIEFNIWSVDDYASVVLHYQDMTYDSRNVPLYYIGKFKYNNNYDTGIKITNNKILPLQNAQVIIGDADHRLNSIHTGLAYANNVICDDSITTGYIWGKSAGGGLRSPILVVADLLPNSQDHYTLGSATNKWKEVWATTGTIQTSDRNEKNTIVNLSDNYNTLFDNLQPVSYKFNESTSDRTHTGLIAQDVENAILAAGLTSQDFAGFVKYTKEDSTDGYALRYDEFIALCIDQIQKLKKRVDELENKSEENK